MGQPRRYRATAARAARNLGRLDSSDSGWRWKRRPAPSSASRSKKSAARPTRPRSQRACGRCLPDPSPFPVPCSLHFQQSRPAGGLQRARGFRCRGGRGQPAAATDAVVAAHRRLGRLRDRTPDRAKCLGLADPAAAAGDRRGPLAAGAGAGRCDHGAVKVEIMVEERHSADTKAPGG
jgi:hypothetical protein